MHIKRLIKGKKGSALLLTLLILALLMTLVLSFVVFVRLQLREVTNGQNLRIARQNARLGMSLAISELQKHAGADQRVTVPATTVYPLKDFDELYDGDADVGSSEMYSIYRSKANTSNSRSYLRNVRTYLTPNEREIWDTELAEWWNVSDRNPHWVGIFNSAFRVDRSSNPASPSPLAAQMYERNPDTVYGEFNRQQLPVWLVSGNEQSDFDPFTDTSYPADYFTPDRPLDDPDAPGSNAVWMVKEGSATLKGTDGLDGRVKVPKQTLASGHFAYWVADESTKANFAVREPDEYVNASINSVEYRNRLQVPQRVGWERMEGFADVFDRNPGMNVNDEKFAKVLSQAQIGLVNPGFNDPVKENFHHVTSTSQSLLTDTALGGLKKDLTRYLEDGDGLNDDDPIADPDRYDSKDPRFAAWGGSNTGFPNASAAALDGIPTFGQIRSWYQNEASTSDDGSIDPDPDSGATPIPVYTHFQMGMSYDGARKMILMHWAPMIILWNPMDVDLKPQDYEIEMGLVVALDKMLIVNQHTSLAERQNLDPEADWQNVNLVGPDFLGPDGKKVLRAVSGSGGNVMVSEVDSAGTYEVFKADLNGSALSVPGGGNIRYFVKLTGDQDAFNGKEGPWVFDDNLNNATSDAFGNIYYATRPGHTGMVFSRSWENTTKNNSDGWLGNKQAFLRVTPLEGTDAPLVDSMPVDRPFRFRVNTGFKRGEVKVFTLGSDVSWNTTGQLTLIPEYDAIEPFFLYFDFLELVDGPTNGAAGPTDKSLRWVSHTKYNNPPYAQGAPSLKISMNNQVFFETENFGSVDGNNAWYMGMGRDYAKYFQFNNTPAGNGDQDDDKTVDFREELPKFIESWRTLYDFSEFKNDKNLRPQTGSETDACHWSYGESFTAPFRDDRSLGEGSLSGVHHFLPAFSRYNLGALSYVGNAFTEQTRSELSGNNIHPDATTLDPRGGYREGLSSFLYQYGRDRDDMGGVNEVKWDNNQVLAGKNGFALTAVTDAGDNNINGLTQVAIRNARRAESEILSVGQLQQVNLSPYFWQPSFPIGNSDASPYVDREAIAGIHSRIMGTDRYSYQLLPGVRPNHARPTPGNLPIPTAMMSSTMEAIPENGAILFRNRVNGKNFKRSYMGGNTMLDLSYLLNENLWDRFYLSTLTSAPSDLGAPLSNARLRFNDHALSASGTDLLNYDSTAAYLSAVGSLNVNSTSVEAWKSLLTSFRNLKLRAGIGQNPENTVPVTRSLNPIESSITMDFSTIVDEEIGAGGNDKDYSQVLSGFRYLDDDMIQALAERIVDEIRLRGPFYSLSDFVNRRLAPPHGSGQRGSEWYTARTSGYDNGGIWMESSYDPFPGLHGLNGALQRAINLSGINGGVNHPDLESDGGGGGNRYDMVYSVRIKDRSSYTSSGIGQTANSLRGGSNSGAGYKHSVDPAVRSHLDTEHHAGSPIGEAGQLMQGAPGFVTQGDLLAMIAPALTARGDTFKIRAYGDASGGDDANARAWLEAVVQRIPEPVEAAGSTGEDRWRPVNSFGRRFKVVSVRWLTPDEI